MLEEKDGMQLMLWFITLFRLIEHHAVMQGNLLGGRDA